MSHLPVRKEQDCLNCGTEVQGRFCHNCGQQNVVTHQGFWSLVKHFVYDIFHFDGKFWITLQYLFFKPGFVPKEYVSGKRLRYLDPIRMYLFTSAIFFVIFFSISKPNVNADLDRSLSNRERRELALDLQNQLKENRTDTALQSRIEQLLDTAAERKFSSSDFETSDDSFISHGGRRYTSRKHYDSVQAALSPHEKDGWLKRNLIGRTIEIKGKYEGRKSDALKDFFSIFLHNLPYLLFVSLPFFAWILKVVYMRRKDFYYSDHAIFTIYHYIFSFILLLVVFAIDALEDRLGWSILNFVIFGLVCWWLIYLYKSMRRFYEQSRMKTIAKFILVNFAALLGMLLLVIIFLVLSIYQI